MFLSFRRNLNANFPFGFLIRCFDFYGNHRFDAVNDKCSKYQWEHLRFYFSHMF